MDYGKAIFRKAERFLLPFENIRIQSDQPLILELTGGRKGQDIEFELIPKPYGCWAE